MEIDKWFKHLSTDKWIHVAVTKSGGVYIDGEKLIEKSEEEKL